MCAARSSDVDTAVEESQTDAVARRAQGEFVRGVSGFRGVLHKDPDFPAEPGRYLHRGEIAHR